MPGPSGSENTERRTATPKSSIAKFTTRLERIATLAASGVARFQLQPIARQTCSIERCRNQGGQVRPGQFRIGQVG